MHIGILQTGRTHEALVSKHGEYPDMFERLLSGQGMQFSTWPVLECRLPERPACAEGWLITGSRFSTYEDHPWIPPLEDFIRATYEAGVPMIGVCFGHQIIAQALGGVVEKYPGGWSVGRTAYRVDGFQEPLSMLSWHQDQVCEIPPEARVVGSSDSCRNAVLAYKGNALSVQPHPEFDADFVDGLFEKVGLQAVGIKRTREEQSRLHAPLDADKFAKVMAGFFRDPGSWPPS
ncbi:MAG: type 1 glutamine amidotransferase [Rhodobacteraceae bacterium]|nr:type 1 glutamine amidotransferase [Paracoccaceae bacterium]MCY4137476.1 type 1 glutamine amidotransferase [Paracoccaceae bacterium]